MERRRLELPTSSLQSYEPSAETVEKTYGNDAPSPAPSNSASNSTTTRTVDAAPDPELAAVVGAWSDLPAAIRAAVLTLVKASKGTPGGGGAKR